jgi:hypothetical protein
MAKAPANPRAATRAKPRVVKFDPRLLPKTLTIMGKTYSVNVVKELAQDGEEIDGQMQAGEQSININAGLVAMEQAVDTLFHEIFHAAEHNAGLSYNEPWVRPVSTQVWAILKANPVLCYLIMGDYAKVKEILSE